MRLSTSLTFSLGTQAMDQMQSAMVTTQQELSTGLRVQTPADDPVAAAQIVQVNQSIAANAQYSANLGQAQNALELSDSAMSQVDDVLTSARSLVVEANNASISDSDRASIGVQLGQQLQQLISLANTGDGNGGYLYSGFQQTTAPFSASASGASYSGDQGQRLLQVSGSRQIAISDPGSAVFDQVMNGNGTFAVGANSTNTGTGVVGANGVTDPAQLTGDQYSVNFSVSAGANPTTTYSVVDSTKGTTLSSGNAYTSGTQIDLPGMQFSLSGSPASGDSFSVGPSTQQSVFTTLANLVQAMQMPSSTPAMQTQIANSLGQGLQNIDQSMNQVLTTRASLGARMNEVSALTTGTQAQTLQYQTNLSNLQDVDYTTAISQLSQQQLALQAAQASFVKISGLSLFSYLS